MVKLAIASSADGAAAMLADVVVAALRQKPDLVIGLPTGRTAVPFYAALVARHRAGAADFRRARTFNLDEFWGLPPGDPHSYRAFMERHLFAHVNLRPGHTHVPDGAAARWREAARRYEEAIAAAGGIDLCVVGIGANGHLAFNEPAGALAAGTHRQRLSASTRQANAHLFGGRRRAVPAYAITMGIGTILRARLVLLLATGAGKRAIVGRALAGPVTTRVPASLLQTHPNAVAILDRRAARALAGPIVR
jgi:glucosamine-6-phosphate deaminase